ncbi:VIT domain-containing protein [Acidobacteriota bacterium]
MKPLSGLLTALFILMTAGIVQADGIIIPVQPRPDVVPIPRPRPIRIPPPSIKYHRVNITIRDQMAEIEVDQVFVNEYHREIEGIYIFPIPENAAINKFSMWADGKELKGKILDAAEAKKIYRDIVSSMRDPALLEYIGRDMFKASVYPIPARGEKRIRLSYTELLSKDQDTVRLLYPLSTEKFSSKPLQEVAINVEVQCKTTVENIYSPSHHISIHRDGNRKFTCGFEDKNVKPDTDFLLYYTLSEDDVGLHLFSCNDGGQGYVMLLASPKPGSTADSSLPKDVVFVMDSSGSMRGEKIDQAKDAAEYVLKNLNPRDRFNIIDFDNGVSWFKEGLVPADEENLDEGIAFVQEVEASGGTNINAAVVGALKMLDDRDRPGYVLFLTDGEPTVGITEEPEILKSVSHANSTKSRLFVFGVGYDVNAKLLDRMATENHGVPQYVKPKENIEVSVSSLFEKISYPVMSDLALRFEGIRVRDIYPTEMPDLFKGSQLVAVGRYSGSGQVKAVLTGKVEKETRTFAARARFGKKETDHPFLPRIWATRRIAFLLEEIRLHGGHKELEDEVRELGLRFGIVTPYTSFLVTEEEKKELARREVGDMPSEQMRVVGQSPVVGFSKSDMEASTGRQAVQQSLRLKKAKEATVEARLDTSRIKHVKDRTFHLENGVWVDSRFEKGMKEITLSFGSEDYFRLLNDEKDLASYFSVGTKCIVAGDGVAYRIVED